ncbi:MAG: hypothetical protein ACLQM8_09090 [Limisphaerales bacterium]
MNATRPADPPLLTVLRWAARLSALALAGLVLLMAVGEGFNPFKLKPSELALSVPFWACWLGLCLGCRWEGLGGLLAVGGVAGFYLVDFAVTGFRQFPRGWAFPALAIPGVLFLLSWFWRRRAAHSPA